MNRLVAWWHRRRCEARRAVMVGRVNAELRALAEAGNLGAYRRVREAMGAYIAAQGRYRHQDRFREDSGFLKVIEGAA